MTQSALAFTTKTISADGQDLTVIMERVEMNAVIEPKDEFDLTKYFISQTKQSYRNQEDGQEENQGPDPDIPSAGDDTVYPADEPFFDIADDGTTGPKMLIFGQTAPDRMTFYQLWLVTTLEGPLGTTTIRWGYKFTLDYTVVPPRLDAEVVAPTFTNPCD